MAQLFGLGLLMYSPIIIGDKYSIGARVFVGTHATFEENYKNHIQRDQPKQA